ncbi:MAG TPA: hypothetical protein VGH42_09415, partial [Verrucomicrobiae bacterium]
RMSSIQASSTLQTQAESMASLIKQIQIPGGGDGTNGGYQPNGFTANFDTNGLWLEALNGETYLPLTDLRALAMTFSRSMSKAKVIRSKVSNVGIRCSCSIKVIV